VAVVQPYLGPLFFPGVRVICSIPHTSGIERGIGFAGRVSPAPPQLARVISFNNLPLVTSMKPAFVALSLLAFVSSASTSAAQTKPAPLSQAAATAQPPRPIQALYSFKTENAPGYIAALDKFMTACGKGLTLSLFANSFDSSDQATHTAIFNFTDPKQFDTLVQTQNCPGSAIFFSTVGELGDRVNSTMGMVVMAGGDATKDQAFRVVQMTMKTTDEAAYLAAFQDWIKASPPVSSYGLVRIIGGSNADFTHYAYFGNKSVTEIAVGLASQPGPNAAFQKFTKKADSLRTTFSTLIVSRVKDYNAPQ
jgi:hypothetical protein